MIIGLSGKIGSGKSHVANYIETHYGYRRLSTSDLLSSILISNGRTPTRENLQNIGNDIIKIIGGGGFMAAMLVYLPKGNYLIDSVRHLDALHYMKKEYKGNFHNIFIKSSFDTRFSRIQEQYSDIDRFKIIDNALTETEIDSIESHSDFVINNESTASELEIQIEKIFQNIL